LNQTYQDFEIIVVDDGSKDNTEEVVRGFNDKRIRYIWHEVNKGGSAARNTGIRAARGEYIAFQDSDDEWLSQKLEKQMKVFEKVSPKVGVVYTGYWRLKGDKKTYIPSSKVSQKEGDIHKILLEVNFVTTQAVVVKTECFERAGMFEEELRRLEDWEMWIRISKFYRFKCIDEPLVVSYYTSGSISADESALIRARKLILEKHFEDTKKDRGLLAKHYRDIGLLLCSNGEMGQGRKYFITALKVYPLNIRPLLLAFISLFGQGAYNKAIESYRKIRGWW